MCLNCSSIEELLIQLIGVLTTILPRAPCKFSSGLFLRQEVEVCSEIKALRWNTLGVLFTILQWEQFLVNPFVFPAVCCWIDSLLEGILNALTTVATGLSGAGRVGQGFPNLGS